MHKILIPSLILPFLAIGIDYLSPVDIDPLGDGSRLIVTQHTGKRVDIYDTAGDKLVDSFKLKERPTGAVGSPSGDRVYVTSGLGEGTVTVFSDKGKKLKTIDAGHSPVAPVISPDGSKLYVCDRFANSVRVFDVDRFKQICVIPVVREPIACTITPDGSSLYVANHLPDGRADADYVASKVSVIDLAANKVLKTIRLVNGAEGMRGICVSPDGAFVYATHLMARFLVPTTQIERGWINTNAVSVIRTSDQKLLYTVLLDDVDMGFANPWAVKVSADGTVLAVSSAGNNEVRLIDLPGMTAKIEERVAKMGKKAKAMHLNAHNDLSFISSVSQRVKLKGVGPRSMCMVNDTVYLGQYFSDSLCKVTLAQARAKAVEAVPLGPDVPITRVRQGEIFFNDATLCFQNWQSCASCHPDARTDALNWDLLNDGIGNPKNVKSMFFSHKTPPVMALGVRDKAETAVRAGIKYIQFAVRPEEAAEAIDDYLRSLSQVPSPRLVKGKLSKPAKRGKKIFDKSGCINCHPAPLFTDLKTYDVGTGKGRDKGKAFDVPTFREVWRSSPYMHDGRAVSIYEVIKIHNPDDRRGATSSLSDQQIRDLAEYIESL